MSLTERERHDAYEALQTAFGDSTDSVIRMFRTDHENLATKDDVAVATAVLRTEMAELRVQFSNDINSAFAAQTRTMTIGLVASVILIALTNTLTVLLG